MCVCVGVGVSESLHQFKMEFKMPGLCVLFG